MRTKKEKMCLLLLKNAPFKNKFIKAKIFIIVVWYDAKIKLLNNIFYLYIIHKTCISNILIKFIKLLKYLFKIYI